MKMWGPYPVLVKSTAAASTTTAENKEEAGGGGVITGMAYDLESRDDLWKLAYYEGYNYQLMEVDITIVDEDHVGEEGEKVVVKGGVFAWVGDEGELSEGKFDVDEYIEAQKKRFMVGF